MNKICTEHLEPGMVLLKDVAGADGSLLAKAGEVLDEDRIDHLADLGVSHVFIRLPKTPDPGLILRRADKYVRDFFLYVDPDEATFSELYRLCLDRTAKAVLNGWDLPCSAEVKAKNVEHMSDLFFRGEGDPLDIVRHENELASFPDIYFKIREVLDSPTSTADDIARVVNTDLGLSAKLLRLVNSPLYGFSTPIDSVARAVALVGVKELSILALGITTMDFFKDIPPELIDMKTFWRHSLSCGILAKLLASSVPGLQPERFFTAGLLHDVGRLIMFKNMPYASVQALIYARSSMVPLVEAETVVLGFDHTRVGRLLLTEWKFPASIVDIVAGHHAPDGAASARDAAVVQLADNLANAVDISAGAMFVLPGMEPKSLRLLGFDPASLPGLLANFDRDMAEIVNLVS